MPASSRTDSARATRSTAGARAALLGLCTLLGTAARAIESEHATLVFEGRSFRHAFSAVLAAPQAAVRDIIADHERLHRLNDGITASRVLERGGEHGLVRLLAMRQCVLVFCFSMRFVQQVVEHDDGLLTRIVPRGSSFRDGDTAWRLEALDPTRTRLTVSGRHTPDFWIPPVLGPFVLERVFRREARETCVNIERLARGTDGRP